MYLVMFSSLSIYLFFSIPVESYNVYKSELVHIDSFLDGIDSFPIDIDTLVPDRHGPSFPPMATLAPSETVDPPSPYTYHHPISMFNYHILFISFIQILLHIF